MEESFKYLPYSDIARLEHGRVLWQKERGRKMLLDCWLHVNHPHRERFLEKRAAIESILEGDEKNDALLNKSLEEQGTSLRAMIREIPPIFGKVMLDNFEKKDS